MVAGPTTYVNVAAFPATSSYRAVYMNLPGCSNACATPDVDGPARYRVQSPGAATQSTTVTSGYSLRGLLIDAGITQTPGVVVLTGDHGPVVLGGGELGEHPAPIVWIADDQVHFADAQSPADYLDVPVAGPQILIQSYPGNRLAVTARAADSHLRPGQSASLTATATGGRGGEQLHDVWKTTAGSTVGTGATLERRWPAGTVTTVYAEVTGSDGSIGFSAPLTVTVGAAAHARARTREGTDRPPAARRSVHQPRTRDPRPATGRTGTAGRRARTASRPTHRGLRSVPLPATRASTATEHTRTISPTRPRRPTPRRPHRSLTGPRVAGTAVAGTAVGAAPPSPVPVRARARAFPAAVARPSSAGLGADGWLSLAASGALAGGALLQWGRSRRR